MPLPCEYLPATGSAQQQLVLLHGWGSDREVWRPLLVRLRPWADVTLLDIPGCAPGQGSRCRPELDGVLAAILERSPREAVFVGWSLGGQLAIELAARHPGRVAAVVTVCSNPAFVGAGDWPGMEAGRFAEFRSAVATAPAAALRRFRALQASGAGHPRRLLRCWQHAGSTPAGDDLLAGLGWLQSLDQRDTVAGLTQPQLHLLAGRDALVPPAVGRHIAARLTGPAPGRVEVLPGACHLAPLDSAAELARHLRQFLADTGTLRSGRPVAVEVQKKEVAASFSRAASAYDSAAGLQREVGKQLLTLLDPQWDAPGTVLDLGCGTGHFRAALARRYPGSRYLGLDIAPGMVAYARDRCGGDGDWLLADAEALPLATGSVDLVFSSLAVQWCYRPEHLFAELARVLRPGGRCVFTSFAPGTLRELRQAWAAVDGHQHVNRFLPASDLADAAGRVPGLQLTLEQREFRLEYARVGDLLNELKTLGAHNMSRNRPAGLTGRRALQGMLQAYETRRDRGALPATWDVLFGTLEKL